MKFEKKLNPYKIVFLTVSFYFFIISSFFKGYVEMFWYDRVFNKFQMFCDF